MADSNLITIPQTFSQVPAHLQSAQAENDMAAGVGGGFGIISYRGKVWRTKFRGEETALMREDGDGPKNSIDIVVVKAAPNLSKIFFEQGYVEGSNAAPDCFSTNGIVPDPGANKKQSRTCAGCPKNAWGSRITEAGKQGKACSDSKRLAVVPAADIKNEAMGGPMLLRVPAASLQDMAVFSNQMAASGFQYNTYIMNISFDPADAFPKFVFKAVRPLTPDEWALVQELGDGPVSQRILVEAVDVVTHDVAVPAQAAEKLPEASQVFTGAKAPETIKTGAQAHPTVTVPPLKAETPQAKAAEAAFGGTVVTQHVTPKRPKFDPETGQPIVYPDEKPAPAQVQVPPLQAAEPQGALPEMKSFDDALANLLG